MADGKTCHRWLYMTDCYDELYEMILNSLIPRESVFIIQILINNNNFHSVINPLTAAGLYI